MIQAHPNSRKVTIFRVNSFAVDAQLSSALEFISLSKKSIGSYWEKSTGKAVGSGLSFSEQRLLMPHIIDCEPEDRQFRQKIADYFGSMKTTVDYEKGITLEIGLETDNSKPITADNMPLDPHEFITWRHAIGHPYVALSKKEAQRNMLKEFYVYDPQAVENEDIQQAGIKDRAMGIYLKLREESKTKPEKIDAMLTLLLEDPRDYSGKNAAAQKAAKLETIMQSQCQKFIDAYEKKHFEEWYVIQSLINTSIWKQVGQKVIDPDEGITIGHSIDESVAWVKDPKNSARLSLLKGKMQEALSSPLPQHQKRKYTASIR